MAVVWSSLIYAISYNYTFYLYPGNYSDKLLDKNSLDFKKTAYKFCKDIENITNSAGLRAINRRYMGCVVDEFTPNREVKFRVALRDTEVLRPSSMFGMFSFMRDKVNLDGVYHLPVGGLYVTVDTEPKYSLFKMDTFSTHSYYDITTTAPVVYTVLTVSLQMLRPQWSAELTNSSSEMYKRLAGLFCDRILAWISNWYKDTNTKCGNVKFR
uniref:SEA domain-containing protein n=1 Tax=Biomphalaria glabrata TaxID=6526 RepID=A0A2C9KMK1_BIOGL